MHEFKFETRIFSNIYTDYDSEKIYNMLNFTIFPRADKNPKKKRYLDNKKT